MFLSFYSGYSVFILYIHWPTTMCNVYDSNLCVCYHVLGQKWPNKRVQSICIYPIISMFFRGCVLEWLYCRILTDSYLSRESWVFVFFDIVHLMCENDKIQDDPRVVIAWYQITFIVIIKSCLKALNMNIQNACQISSVKCVSEMYFIKWPIARLLTVIPFVFLLLSSKRKHDWLAIVCA